MDTAYTIVLTGASTGVGARAAERLGEAGHTVYAWARSIEALHQAAQANPNIIPMQVDIRDPGQVAQAYETIERDHDPVQVLINNAGIVQNIPFAEQALDRIDDIIDTNLKGSLYCTRLVLPYMISRAWGRIINISSVAGVRGIPGQVTYCASKHGMNGFADALAQELIPHNILLSSICPGGIQTPLWNEGTNPYPGDLSKVMKPDEIVDIIMFLLLQPDHTLYKQLTVFPTNEWH